MKKKWDLEPILKIQDFDRLYQELERDWEKMKKYVDELKPDITTEKFRAILEFSEQMEEKMARLGGLPGLMEAVDQKNPTAKLLKSRAENLALKWSELGISMSLWIKGKREPYLDDQNAQRILGVIKDLEYGLKRGRQLAQYSLSEREENIVVNKDVNGMGVVGELREMIAAEMEYELKIGKKTKRIKTQAELLALVYSPRDEVRKAAYRALLTKQKENLPKFFAMYQAVVKDWAYETKLRGYTNAMAVRNLANDVPDEAVEELLASCSKNKDIFQSFFRWKAKQLGKKTLLRSDVYAPLEKQDRKYTLEETKELVLGSLAKFSNKFYVLGRELIEGRQIDWEPKTDKRSGAFCATISPKIKPYIMLNFTGKQRDVSTLAHEVGHGIHSMYASGHYPSAQSPNLPLAETASTLAEMILFEEMLTREKDKKIKQALLADKMADAYATIIRQNYFVLFEQAAHQKLPGGMTAENLSDLYFKNLTDQFGGSVVISPDFRYEWSYISHIFESPFYCYAYNFGELLSLGLFTRYKENPGVWQGRIEKILEAGGSRNPEEVLKSVKIDIRQPGFWQTSFEIIREWQKRLTDI